MAGAAGRGAAVGPDGQDERQTRRLHLRLHGMAPFHTAVNAFNLLRNVGVDTTKIGIRTTGPAVHVYVNLLGREQGGTVDTAMYLTLVDQIASALDGAQDPNAFFNPTSARLFSKVWRRPTGCGSPGFCTDENIGQDFGDVFALMVEGYNFDGAQTPVVPRLGDSDAAVTSVYSVPNFYGAHGHDSELASMSATFMAAGPDIKQRRRLRDVRNVDGSDSPRASRRRAGADGRRRGDRPRDRAQAETRPRRLNAPRAGGWPVRGRSACRSRSSAPTARRRRRGRRRAAGRIVRASTCGYTPSRPSLPFADES